MNGILKVDPQQLITTAGEFETVSGQVQTITGEMMSIIDRLKPAWEGEAATVYDARFDALQDDMDRMYRMIREHVEDLKNMAQEYITAENENVDTGNALASDVIS